MATGAQPVGRTSPLYRPLVFVLFVAGGFAIFLFGNNWNTRFATNSSDLYKWSLPLVFGAAALVLARAHQPKPAAIALALLNAALANAMLASFGRSVGELLPDPQTGAQRLALDKLAQTLIVAPTLIVFSLIVDRSLGAIFLKRDSSRWGLKFGLVTFAAFAAIFAVLAVLQAGAAPRAGLTATGVPLSTIVIALPWILVFNFMNSFMEELWFRGIFLGKLRPVLGATLAIVATAFVFASIHFGAVYVTEMQRVIFAGIAFGLGLLNAWVMLRSDSIWGSVLIHAGYDFFVIIPMLTKLG